MKWLVFFPDVNTKSNLRIDGYEQKVILQTPDLDCWLGFETWV